MRLLISFAALFSSVLLLQLGFGGVVPLDALSGTLLGFSSQQIGFLGSAHFLGFFIGCWWAPRLMGSVGHSRAFGAFTAAGTISIRLELLGYSKQTSVVVIPAVRWGAWATPSRATTTRRESTKHCMRAPCRRSFPCSATTASPTF